MMRSVLVLVLLSAIGLVAVPGASAAESFVSPGCDTALEVRLDWASDREADTAADVDRTPSEAMHEVYTQLRLCDGDVIRQSGDTIRGPKEPGVEPASTFQPTGRETTSSKKRGRAGRVLTCSNTAFDPQFLGASVRAGGRSSCNQSASLSATTCIGRYFQSTGNSDQTTCNAGGTYGSVITVYTGFIGCYDVISYRSNFYGHTGNSFSFYFNGLYNGCL